MTAPCLGVARRRGHAAASRYVTEALGARERRARHARLGRRQRPWRRTTPFEARPGRTYRLRQIASLVPSRSMTTPTRRPSRLASKAGRQGFDALRAENRAAWQELWKGRVADRRRRRSLAARSPTPPSSTSTLRPPVGAIEHLDLRPRPVERLPLLLRPRDVGHRDVLRAAARPRPARRGPDACWTSGPRRSARRADNAKLHGRRGLQFPWESGPLNGEEASPGSGEASWYEDHVSLDVAWAFAQYNHATGDGRFLHGPTPRRCCTASPTGSRAG